MKKNNPKIRFLIFYGLVFSFLIIETLTIVVIHNQPPCAMLTFLKPTSIQKESLLPKGNTAPYLLGEKGESALLLDIVYEKDYRMLKIKTIDGKIGYIESFDNVTLTYNSKRNFLY